MIDSPTASVTYRSNNGRVQFSWISPTIPIMHAGESVPVFGALPDLEIDGGSHPEFTFALCTDAKPGIATDTHLNRPLELEIGDGEFKQDSYSQYVVIRNIGTDIATNPVTRGFVRDSQGRIAGLTPQYRHPPIAPGRSRGAYIQASEGNGPVIVASPFPLLPDDGYSLELRPGPNLWDSLLSRGCTFGLPWEEESEMR